jgi:copper homeostasis protein
MKIPGSAHTFIKEACVDTLENALRAQKYGATRIELCSRLDLDGLTPTLDLMASVIEKLTIPVHVMIRPRPGNFQYSSQEIATMKNEIRLCKRFNADGVVVGALTEDGKVDLPLLQLLAQEAAPLKVVFHKAIDTSADILHAVRDIRSVAGVTGILTSGGCATAIEGMPVIRKMMDEAGSELEIIVAGKVTVHNLRVLHETLGAKAYHGKKIVMD